MTDASGAEDAFETVRISVFTPYLTDVRPDQGRSPPGLSHALRSMDEASR